MTSTAYDGQRRSWTDHYGQRRSWRTCTQMMVNTEHEQRRLWWTDRDEHYRSWQREIMTDDEDDGGQQRKLRGVMTLIADHSEHWYWRKTQITTMQIMNTDHDNAVHGEHKYWWTTLITTDNTDHNWADEHSDHDGQCRWRQTTQINKKKN